MPERTWEELVVEEHPGRITVLPGEDFARGEADVTMSEQTYRRAYNGYMCPWCYQELSTAFDRTCRAWCCGGDVEYTQDEWHRYMDGTLDGFKWLGPSKETLEQLEARPAESTEIWTPGRG